jgi:hypothetical protein
MPPDQGRRFIAWAGIGGLKTNSFRTADQPGFLTHAKDETMTKIDAAIELCTEDEKKWPDFYNLFLNSHFFVPILHEKDVVVPEDGALPLLVEANDNTYLMLFDTIGRLTDWADEDTKYLGVTGHGITEMSSANIYWALNYGTESQKFFEPEEIGWLKTIVRQAKEDSDEQSSAAGDSES